MLLSDDHHISFYKKDILTLEREQKRSTGMVGYLTHLSNHEGTKTLRILTPEYNQERADIMKIYRLYPAGT